MQAWRRYLTSCKDCICSVLDSGLGYLVDPLRDQVCEDIGRQLLNYGRRLSLAETFARIDAVDAPTIRCGPRRL